MQIGDIYSIGNGKDAWQVIPHKTGIGFKWIRGRRKGSFSYIDPSFNPLTNGYKLESENRVLELLRKIDEDI